MNKFLTVLITIAIFTGCYKTEYSGTLSEKGKVADCFYTAAQVTHTRSVTVTNNNNNLYNNYDDDNYYTSYSGNNYGKRQRNSGPQVYYNDAINEIPAKYGVMFECEHGTKFVIEGTKAKHKSLWQRMKKDSTVTIFYREIYHVDTKTGQKTLFDYDFLDAK
jgi:hypothetical protein